MTEEADAVSATLRRAGWNETLRLSTPRMVALALSRGTDERAVRVVTQRGVAVSLDSHEPNGISVRHGAVGLAPSPNPLDVTGDGVEEVVLVRDGQDGSRCIAVIAVDPVGLARRVVVEADAIAVGACASGLRDVDDDGTVEAIIALRWPELAFGRSEAAAVPQVEVALAYSERRFRSSAIVVSYIEAERARRLERLEQARARYDVAESARWGVELAALAGLGGASPAAQVRTFDAATAGLILSEGQADRLASIRAMIIRGWPSSAP